MYGEQRDTTMSKQTSKVKRDRTSTKRLKTKTANTFHMVKEFQQYKWYLAMFTLRAHARLFSLAKQYPTQNTRRLIQKRT